MIFLSDVVVLPQTEKVLRNLFASAEEVPHVLRSFFHLRFTSRTSGTHKGSSFQNTRQRTSSCILCTRRAIQRPLCATCGLTHDFFTCASLDGYAQGSCGGRIRHLWPADGQLRVSAIQPHRQIGCPQRSLAKRIELAIGIR